MFSMYGAALHLLVQTCHFISRALRPACKCQLPFCQIPVRVKPPTKGQRQRHLNHPPMPCKLQSTLSLVPPGVRRRVGLLVLLRLPVVSAVAPPADKFVLLDPLLRSASK